MIDLIILFVISIFIFWRLWAVLGQRNSPTSTQSVVSLDKHQVRVEKKSSQPASDFFPGFNEIDFLSYVDTFFQKVLFAFYRKDKKSLRAMVTPKLLESTFNHDPTTSLDRVCVTELHIRDKKIEDKTAFVVLDLASQQVFDGKLVERHDGITLKRDLAEDQAPWILTDISSTERT